MKNIVLIIILVAVIAVLVQFVVRSPKSEQLPLDNPSAEIAQPVDQSAVSASETATINDTTTGANNPVSSQVMPPTDSPQQVQLTTTASGLQYGIITPGSGKVAASGDLVTVHYIGTLTDGREFDSSVGRGQPAQFPIGVGQLIKGWDEGIPGMKVGEKRVLVVPGNLAYGSNPPPGSIIGPDATLVFQVELIDTQSPGAR